MSKIWGTLTFFANVYPMNSLIFIKWNFCTTILIPLFWCFKGVKREGKDKKQSTFANTQILISFKTTWSFLILIKWSFLRLLCKFKFWKSNSRKYITLKAQLNHSPRLYNCQVHKFCEQFDFQNCLPVSVSLYSAFGLIKYLIHLYSQHHLSSPVKDSV